MNEYNVNGDCVIGGENGKSWDLADSYSHAKPSWRSHEFKEGKATVELGSLFQPLSSYTPPLTLQKFERMAPQA